MANSRNWSTASAPCRIELRGSRALAFSCGALGVLAALALLVSPLPTALAAGAAVVAIVYGAHLARVELRRAHTGLTIPYDGAVTVDGEPVNDLHVAWRGPAAFLRWRDATGRLRRRVAAPDILPAGDRRALRLACAARTPAHRRPPVAP